jgi:DNA modification methylase
VLYRWLADHSEYLRENFIWDKGPNRATIPIGNIVMKRYEYVLMFTKDPKFEINNFRENKAIKYRNEFGKWISNLFELPLDYENVEHVKKHRAGFPLQLPKMFIDIYSPDEGVVLDPFNGLGSCGVAAKQLNRKYIGIELVKQYCDISIERLSQEYFYV